jgi:hypothetical protein
MSKSRAMMYQEIDMANILDGQLGYDMGPNLERDMKIAEKYGYEKLAQKWADEADEAWGKKNI